MMPLLSAERRLRMSSLNSRSLAAYPKTAVRTSAAAIVRRGRARLNRHSPSVPPGTGVEFYAEMNAYVVISSCPWVNQTVAVGDIEPMPLYVSVSETGIAPLDPPEWKDWQTPFYQAVASGGIDISPRTADSYSRP